MSKAGWKDEFNKLWNKMMNRKDSEFFRNPVDWEGMGLLDYPQIIKEPMDLTTLKKKFDSGKYSSPTELAYDTRLIFSNAMTYNLQNSRVYTHAKTLGDFFENNWSLITNARDSKDRPPSSEALMEFVDKCYRLVPDDLGKIMKLLEEKCPNCLLKRPDTHEVDVNTDLINGPTFHEANALIEKMVLEPPTPSANRRGK